MRIQNRRIETLIFLIGLLMAVTPMAVTLAIGDNFPSTAKDSENRNDSELRTDSESVEIVMLSSTLVRSSDFPPMIRHKPTIRWKFMKEYGVWGVKFHSLSLPYTNGCRTDYIYIRDLSRKNHKLVHCGETTPEEFISQGSKLEVEFHSDSDREIRDFDFRVDHGENEDDVRRQFSKEPTGPQPVVIAEVPNLFSPRSTKLNSRRPEATILKQQKKKQLNSQEVPLQISNEEKAAIISLSMILPIALIIVGLLGVALAKNMNAEKKARHHEVLPTHCPQSSKTVPSNQSKEKESTVVDFFLDNDKLTVKPGKVKFQDKRTDKTMSNFYADMPSSLEICTTVANHDIKPPPPNFDEKLIGFGSLM